MKLEKWALIAEIIGSLAVVVTLIFLIVEINKNTEATRAANRQSVASRSEALISSQATSSELAGIIIRDRDGEELSRPELFMLASWVSVAIRIVEEAYLQFEDGNLDEEYLRIRATNLIESRISTPFTKAVYCGSRRQGAVIARFGHWLDQNYGKICPE